MNHRRIRNAAGRVFAWLDHAVEATLAVLLAEMVLVGFVQVLARRMFNHSLAWTEELQIYSHIWLVLLAIPVAYRRGAHLGMHALRQRLGARARRGLGLLTDLLWLLFAGALVWFSAFHHTPIGKTFLEIAARNRSPALQLPHNVLYLCLVAGGVYLGIVALRRIFGGGAPDEEAGR